MIELEDCESHHSDKRQDLLLSVGSAEIELWFDPKRRNWVLVETDELTHRPTVVFS